MSSQQQGQGKDSRQNQENQQPSQHQQQQQQQQGRQQILEQVEKMMPTLRQRMPHEALKQIDENVRLLRDMKIDHLEFRRRYQKIATAVNMHQSATSRRLPAGMSTNPQTQLRSVPQQQQQQQQLQQQQQQLQQQIPSEIMAKIKQYKTASREERERLLNSDPNLAGYLRKIAQLQYQQRQQQQQQQQSQQSTRTTATPPPQQQPHQLPQQQMAGMQMPQQTAAAAASLMPGYPAAMMQQHAFPPSMTPHHRQQFPMQPSQPSPASSPSPQTPPQQQQQKQQQQQQHKTSQQQSQQSQQSSTSKRKAGRPPGSGKKQETDVSSMLSDVTRIAGVDVNQEQETLYRAAPYSGSGGFAAPHTQDADSQTVDRDRLSNKMEQICRRDAEAMSEEEKEEGKEAITKVDNEAIGVMAEGVEMYMRQVLEELVKCKNHRRGEKAAELGMEPQKGIDAAIRSVLNTDRSIKERLEEMEQERAEAERIEAEEASKRGRKKKRKREEDDKELEKQALARERERTETANKTALAAIGDRRRKKRRTVIPNVAPMMGMPPGASNISPGQQQQQQPTTPGSSDITGSSGTNGQSSSATNATSTTSYSSTPTPRPAKPRRRPSIKLKKDDCIFALSRMIEQRKSSLLHKAMT